MSTTSPSRNASTKRRAAKRRPGGDGAPAAPASAAGKGTAAVASGKGAKALAAGAGTGSKAKPAAPPRTKYVKGSYKLPKDDHALFAVLKERAAATGARPRKNELIRAGLHALMESGRMELRRALERLPALK